MDINFLSSPGLKSRSSEQSSVQRVTSVKPRDRLCKLINLAFDNDVM